jgi:ATP-dependent helicase/DNAse subunit B
MGERSSKSEVKKSKFIQMGGSLSGSHFFGLYENCQMNFFLRYVLGWESVWSTPALINGTAMHAAKEVFYSMKRGTDAQRIRKPVQKYLEVMDVNRKKIISSSLADFEKLRDRGTELFPAWVETFGGGDLEKYEILGVEREMRLDVPWRKSKFVVTGKLDLLVRDKRGKWIIILDTKTTSFSLRETEYSVMLGDQATAYISMARQAYPKDEVKGMIADIMYWHDNSKKVESATLKRSEVIVRYPADVAEYKVNMGNLIAECSSKVAAWGTGKWKEPVQLFRRNSQWCYSFFRECEYSSWCRRNMACKAKEVPFEFEKVNVKKIVERVKKGDV